MGRKRPGLKRVSSEFENFKVATRARIQRENLSESEISDTMENTTSVDNLLNLTSPFSGKKNEDIKYFVTEFDNLAKNTSYKDNIKLIILKSKLVGAAKERIIIDENLRDETSYDTFKEKLIKALEEKLSFAEAHKIFSNISQNPNESIENYLLRFNSVAAKFLQTSGLADKQDAKRLVELMKINLFTDSLKPKIALEIRKKSVNTFNEAAETALIMENAFEIMENAQINTINNKLNNESFAKLLEINKNQQRELEQLKEEMEEIESQERINEHNPNFKFNKTFCSICRTNKHTTAYCWYNGLNKRYQPYRRIDCDEKNKYQENNTSGYKDKKYLSKMPKGQNRKDNRKEKELLSGFGYFNQNPKPEGYSMKEKSENSKQNKSNNTGRRENITQTIASVNNTNSKNLPIVNFEIKDIKIRSLVDTGAAVSILSPTLFAKIKDSTIKIKYLGTNINIKSFSGTAIPFTHCIRLSFKLGGAFTTGIFYVTRHEFNNSYNMIFGFDYLKFNRIIIDTEKNYLKLKNIEIPLNVNKSSSNVSNINSINSTEQEQSKTVKKKKSDQLFVKVAYKVYIKPGQKKIITLVCPKFVEEGSMVLFQPKLQTPEIECFHSVHEILKSRIINIIIENNSEKKIIFNKGKSMGFITTYFDFQTDKLPEEVPEGSVHKINTLNLEEVHKLREAEISKEDFDLSHLSEDTQKQFEKVLLENVHAFSKTYQTLGQTSRVIPKIKLIHDYPIQCKPYKTPYTVREYAEKEIKKLLQAKIIERSSSAYSFPALFVKKKTAENQEQKFRMAVDYRLLNAVLEGYSYPIPDIKDLLQRIGGKKYFTVLDLSSAFFQINLLPQDREKLAFITEYGKFQPVRLNFGLKISPTTFAELMDDVFADFNKEELIYFFDDILLATNTLERMLALLTEVLERLIANNLTLDPKKIQLAKKEIEFLGFNVHEKGYSPSQHNIHKIEKLARPTTKKGVKSLLGLANYFRFLIHKYSDIVNPLVELTKEKVKFKWSKEAEEAFLAIQQAIINNPTVKNADLTKQFYLITDASKTALSAILCQKEGEKYVPIEFYGRKLSESEKCYKALKYELLCIHDACNYFEKFLAGKKFTILTDSKALTENLNLQHQSDIIRRWMMRLSNFDYEIKHIPGKENPADFVSRNICSITTDNKIQNDLFKVNLNLTEDKVREEQMADPKLHLIIRKIQTKKENKTTRKFTLNDKNTLILKQKPNAKTLMIAPKKIIFEIIEEAHKSHHGFPKTYELIKSRFFWYGMFKDTKAYCASCVSCNQNKQHQTIKAPVQGISKNVPIGSRLHIDIVGKLPLTFRKHAFILTVIDAGSRFLQAYALRNVESQTVLNCLTNYFSTFGLCKEVMLDNAAYFRSGLFTEYMKALGVELHYSSPYKPSSNGLIEVTHKQLKSCIQAMSSKTSEWDLRIPFYILSYNTSVHRAIGFRPDVLFYARETANHFTALNNPDMQCTHQYVQKRISHIKEVRKAALANQEKIMKEYATTDFTKITQLNIGDQVYIKVIGKPLALQPKFDGPFIVTNVLRNLNYLLQNINEPNSRKIKRHISHLFKPSAKIDLNTAPTTDVEQEETQNSETEDI